MPVTIQKRRVRPYSEWGGFSRDDLTREIRRAEKIVDATPAQVRAHRTRRIKELNDRIAWLKKQIEVTTSELAEWENL